jgi:hypothetical protein
VQAQRVKRRRVVVVAFVVMFEFVAGGVWPRAGVEAGQTGHERVRQERASSARTTEEAIVEISGAKTPEQLPEYLVWKIGLRALAGIEKQKIAPALEELGLSPADGELVFAEGRAQQERDKECFERQERTTAMLKAADAKADRIAAETRAIVMECRWATLEGKERMLAALSPDAQIAVIAWVLEQRRQINVTVHRAELEFFRQPR